MKSKGFIWLVCFGIAFIFLAICSKSSFLYPMNDWVDANCYITVAKSMLHGKVLYSDIYEQKGPLLYMMHCIAYLISKNSFFGVFLLEVSCFTVFLRYAYNIVSLYMKENAIYALPILGTVILAASSFAHGDSAEEMCLPLLTISFYLMLDCIKNKKEFTTKVLIINGILAGCVFWIKFSMVGFYLGYMLAILLLEWKNKRMKQSVKKCLWFLLGMGIATLPHLIYFAANSAMKDLFEAYIYNNMFLYKYDTYSNLFHRVFSIIVNTSVSLVNNPVYGVLILIGFVWLYCEHRGDWFGRVAPILLGITLPLGVFWSGVAWIYYGFIFNVFTVLGVIWLLDLLSKRLSWFHQQKIVLPLMILGGAVLCAVFSKNTYLLKYEKEDLPQYKFAKIIQETDDPTLLNYDFLDGGFYTAAEILPSGKYFCLLNIPLEEMLESLDDTVEQGKVDYVVTRDMKYSWEHYRLVDEAKFYYEGRDYTYYLYKHTNLIQNITNN